MTQIDLSTANASLPDVNRLVLTTNSHAFNYNCDKTISNTIQKCRSRVKEHRLEDEMDAICKLIKNEMLKEGT